MTAPTLPLPAARPASVLLRLGRALAFPFVVAGQATRARHEYERLSRMSDAGLAKMGLIRDDIVAHACRDLR